MSQVKEDCVIVNWKAALWERKKNLPPPLEVVVYPAKKSDAMTEVSVSLPKEVAWITPPKAVPEVAAAV